MAYLEVFLKIMHDAFISEQIQFNYNVQDTILQIWLLRFLRSYRSLMAAGLEQLRYCENITKPLPLQTSVSGQDNI